MVPTVRKPAIFLREAGLPHRIVPVDLSQKRTDDFLALNPNGKIPVLVDEEQGVTLFESAAILQYLAERSGRFLPSDGPRRAEVLQWLAWQAAAVSPAVEQLGHFLFRDEKLPYPIDRFADMCVRYMRVLDVQLTHRAFVTDEYSIADIGLFPFVKVLWAPLREIRPDQVADFGHIEGWLQRVGERPAVLAVQKELA